MEIRVDYHIAEVHHLPQETVVAVVIHQVRIRLIIILVGNSLVTSILNEL